MHHQLTYRKDHEHTPIHRSLKDNKIRINIAKKVKNLYNKTFKSMKKIKTLENGKTPNAQGYYEYFENNYKLITDPINLNQKLHLPSLI